MGLKTQPDKLTKIELLTLADIVENWERSEHQDGQCTINQFTGRLGDIGVIITKTNYKWTDAVDSYEYRLSMHCDGIDIGTISELHFVAGGVSMLKDKYNAAYRKWHAQLKCGKEPPYAEILAKARSLLTPKVDGVK